MSINNDDELEDVFADSPDDEPDLAPIPRVPAFGKEWILSDDLTAADLPPPFADWRQIIEFSATYDIENESIEIQKMIGLASVGPGSSVSDLRCSLYCEWRRYNHFGRRPDESVVKLAWQAIEWLRVKVYSR